MNSQVKGEHKMAVEHTKFIELCKKFENLVDVKFLKSDKLEKKESKYKSPYYFIESEFDEYKDTIAKVRKLRNLIQHNDIMIDETPMINLSPLLIEKFEEIIEEILNPITAKSVLTEYKDIIFATETTKINELVKKMNLQKITNIPVMKGQRLIGVFSENTIFNKLSAEGFVSIEDSETMEKFAQNIDLNSHDNERFVFVNENDEVEKIKKMFRNVDDNGKRLNLIFVTKNGKENDPILGIITPWDVLEF